MHPALLDRMEIIHLSGYTFEEKKHILNKYLLPEAMDHAGVQKELHNFEITDAAKDKILVDYCREAGVRSLKKTINKITEKIAYKIVSEPEGTKISVTPDNLHDFIGNPVFSSRKFYGKDVPPGVVIGLAYN